MIIRPVLPADSASVSALCAAALELEPDAPELPAILGRRAAGRVTVAAEAGGQVIGVGYGSAGQPADHGARGHVDLIAVAPRAQGRGTGAALLGALEERLRAEGATEVRLGHNSPVYLWPGVDPRYTAMTCLAARAGYERYADAVNMAVSLTTAQPDSGPAERRLAAAGVTIRRATAADAGPLARWLAGGPWAASAWPAEVALAARRDPPGCHLACRGGDYLAFACHGVNRRAWFGPMGTLESARGRGIGTVLLLRCLADIRAAGEGSAQIAWVGPVHYYARVIGARIDRMFWLYRKALPRPDGGDG